LGAAAAALGITRSAVSHRIRGLEAELGVHLLRRLSKGLALTEPGRRYRVAVEEAFTRLTEATAELLGPDLSRPLTVSLTSEVGFRWLMPRFQRFRARHPDIDTAILSTDQLADLAAGEADLALRYGNGDWPGLATEAILQFSVSPVCAPRVRDEIAGLPPAVALAGQTLIRADYDAWRPWLEAAGANDMKPARQLRFAAYSMAVTAAIEGQGILLGYSGYIEQEIAEGLLVRPFALEVPIGKGYYLAYLPDRLADPRVRAFRNWAVAEAASAPAMPPVSGLTTVD
jgi:LysR family glycine cleavage system transcriptional activator